ncbi:MAG TPA: LysR family transcriptional regulator [Rubrivivax sp.]|nr:LysR family transcriptional regulator [Rubrivivax sp.]
MAIELRLIQHALAVGRHGNFARAAETLHLTQPSLSRSIAALEGSLGVPLFDRTSKGVVPTAFGLVLLERGDTLLKREADLRREIGLVAGLELGSLAVSAGPYMNETSVARAIGRVAAAHPKLRIECKSADPAEVVRQVLDERVDVGVANASGLDREARLVVQPLPAHRVYLACRPGHPLTREAAPTLARALQFPVVTTRLRGEQAALARRRGDEPEAEDEHSEDYVPQVLVNSIAVARLIAQESDMLVPGTAAMLAGDVASGRLVRLSCTAPAMQTSNGVIYLRERMLSPAARVFIETLHRVEAEAQAADAARPARATPPVQRRSRPGQRR